MKDYYHILGVELSSSSDEIKKAFRINAIKYHPDKHNGDPALTHKFLEVKEAYDILIDNTKRSNYDIEYLEYQNTNSKSSEKYNNIKSEDDKFHYNPQKPYFSFFERIVQKTPIIVPSYNHYYNFNSENSDFFIFPKSIGYILTGQTSLTKDFQPIAKVKFNWRHIQSSIIPAVIIAWLATSILSLYIQGNTMVTLSLVFSITVTLVSVYKFQLSKISRDANQLAYCSYIGVNGFAHYIYDMDTKNMLEEFEINFSQVSDLIKITESKKSNDDLEINYAFIWLNNQTEIKKYEGVHKQSYDTYEWGKHSEFIINTFAENSWTIYLLDKMESELTQKGYIEFKIFGKHPYIRLGIGYIEFIKDNEIFRYNFNDIKRMYIKNTSLFLEHKNYDKKFFFFESGNRDGVPLQFLSNSKFFCQASEILLGYKISEN